MSMLLIWELLDLMVFESSGSLFSVLDLFSLQTQVLCYECIVGFICENSEIKAPFPIAVLHCGLCCGLAYGWKVIWTLIDKLAFTLES
jgi:hypothetical protein